MALFTYDELLNTKIPLNESYEELEKQLRDGITIDDIDKQQYKSFDIFLSHSYNDKKIIPALKRKLEEMGYSVYVDWITDHLLSRNKVTKKTAEILQYRMQQSKCLVYATSDNSKKSRWMPWELGYFDGIKTKMVGILPIKRNDDNFNEEFKGEEYLGLYYYITINKLSKVLEHTVMAMEKEAFKKFRDDLNKEIRLFINENNQKFILFEEWLKGEKPYSMDEQIEEIRNKI